jgi:hypothetical protein
VAARPALLPSKVTLTAPVNGPFDPSTPLTKAPTAVNADVRLPTCEAAEATSARPVPTMDTTLHATALADVHKVVSLALPASREAALKPAWPAFEPSSVTLDAPVAAAFTPPALLTRGRPKDTAAASEARTCSSVMAALADPPTPAPDLHTIDVDDPHADDTSPLPRTDALAL